MFDKDPIESFMKLSEKYGGLFLFDFGPTTAAIITDYKYIDQVRLLYPGTIKVPGYTVGTCSSMRFMIEIRV